MTWLSLAHEETVTYLYEPDSFVPLARIRSDGCQQQGTAHLPRVAQWDLPVTRHDAQLQAAITQEQAASEAHHLSAWQRIQAAADGATPQDRMVHYHCDHLGTPRELTDAQGNVVWSGRYKAWGCLLHAEGEITQPLRFQGQYEDGETGLFYNRYRYYDASTARYLTQDPIGLLGGLNSYQYAPNPTLWTDPQGLSKKCQKNSICDPCAGKNPSATARKWQGTPPYIGVDSYKNMAIQKGTTIYALYHPAQGNNIPSYFVDGKTLAAAGWEHKKLHDLVQVQSTLTDPNGRPPRTLVRQYTVMHSICVASGRAMRNGKFGSGGGQQMFVAEADKINLMQGSNIGLK